MGLTEWTKKAGLLVLLAAIACPGEAQTWNEFFRQKKTQRNYLARQIAALKLYGDYLQQGYEIAAGGLSLVQDVTGGQFRLHKDYFGSLGTISPLVKGSADVPSIPALGWEIVMALREVTASEYLHLSDKAYLRRVREGLLEALLADLEHLLQLVTAGKLELTDGERLGQLQNVLHRIQRNAALARELTAEAQLLIRQRKREQAAAVLVERIYQLNQ